MESILSQLSKLNVATYTGIEDGADKVNFLLSVTILAVCAVIVTTNTYFMKSMACYIAVTASGENLDDYIMNYCWVHGTIAFQHNSTLPRNRVQWLEADTNLKINYYQWVPFVLGLQGIMYYLPRLVWQAMVYSMSGADLEAMVKSAKAASSMIGEDRADTINQIALLLEDMLFQRRNLSAEMAAESMVSPPSDKNYIGWTASSTKTRQPKKPSVLCCSRRTGVFLIILYGLVKLLYLANAIGQIILMQYFLRVGQTRLSPWFGWEILHDIVQGRYWEESRMFPRVSFCYIGGIQLVATANNYLGQCVLTVNMLNEKIYIFLWFWTMGVAIITILSIPIWFIRLSFLSRRRQFVKKFLKMKGEYNKIEHRDSVQEFVSVFLQQDGVFLLHILSLNAGELITTDIVTKLWKIYKDEFNICDFKHGKIEKKNVENKDIPEFEKSPSFV